MTTTAEAIRDRILQVIEQMTPSVLIGDRFARHHDEGDGDFDKWAVGHAVGSLRRFQVLEVLDEPGEVTGVDVEERFVTFEIRVAYPQTARYGADQALDRDDVIEQDLYDIEHAVGEFGRGRFVAPEPEAAWESSGSKVEELAGVDMLVITQRMMYWRAMP